MLRITKLTDYAIVLLSYLAAQYPQHLSAKNLSKNTGISLPTVSKVLKNLHGQQIVISHLGISGGYQLAVPPQQTSLAQIITSLEGPIALTECNIAQGICEHESGCQVKPHWKRINHAVLKALENVSLAQIT